MIDPHAPAPFDGTRFSDPERQPADKSLLDVARWMLGTKRATWPKHRAPTPHAPVPERVGSDEMRVTYVGHATVLLQAGGLNILTDPFWSERASPFRSLGPKRTVPPGLPFAALPPIDAVLLSHNHYDHCDAATLARLGADHAPHIIVPLGNGDLVRPHVRDAAVTEVDWGQSTEITGGGAIARATALWTRHWSRRTAGDMNRALWAAYAIETPAGRIYFAGDTAHRGGAHFDTGARLGPYRLALLPIGAYEPRAFMRDQHMNPEEAVDGFGRIGADHALAIHHGTIQLTNEAIDAPAEALSAALRAADIPADRFRALPPGGDWTLPGT